MIGTSAYRVALVWLLRLLAVAVVVSTLTDQYFQYTVMGTAPGEPATLLNFATSHWSVLIGAAAGGVLFLAMAEILALLLKRTSG